MFFWNSLAFSMIQQMLEIWSLVPFAFSKSRLNIWKSTIHGLLKPGLENFEHHFASVWDECNCKIQFVYVIYRERHIHICVCIHTYIHTKFFWSLSQVFPLLWVFSFLFSSYTVMFCEVTYLRWCLFCRKYLWKFPASKLRSVTCLLLCHMYFVFPCI